MVFFCLVWTSPWHVNQDFINVSLVLHCLVQAKTSSSRRNNSPKALVTVKGHPANEGFRIVELFSRQNGVWRNFSVSAFNPRDTAKTVSIWWANVSDIGWMSFWYRAIKRHGRNGHAYIKLFFGLLPNHVLVFDWGSNQGVFCLSYKTFLLRILT